MNLKVYNEWGKYDSSGQKETAAGRNPPKKLEQVKNLST